MCVCLGNLANICRLRGELSKACGLYRESIELARENGNRLSECIALGNLGSCLARLGSGDEAMEVFSEQLRIAREAGFRNEISGALGSIGQVLREAGRYEEAMARFNEQFRSAWEDNDHSLMSFALSNIASIHALGGDFDRAITCAKRLIRTGRRSQDRGALAQGLSALGRYCMLAGGLEEDAESYLTSAAGHLQELGLTSSLSECLFDLASLRESTGSDLAISTAESALEAALEAGDESMTLLSRMLIASIRGKTDPEGATSDLEELLSNAPDDEHAAAIHYELYRLTGREEHRAGAERLYRRLVESFPNVENRRRLSEVALEGR
jgi:tetratricopeptide (TPR) repeat protein